jgi:hypothetical protein
MFFLQVLNFFFLTLFFFILQITISWFFFEESAVTKKETLACLFIFFFNYHNLLKIVFSPAFSFDRNSFFFFISYFYSFFGPITLFDIGTFLIVFNIPYYLVFGSFFEKTLKLFYFSFSFFVKFYKRKAVVLGNYSQSNADHVVFLGFKSSFATKGTSILLPFEKELEPFVESILWSSVFDFFILFFTLALLFFYRKKFSKNLNSFALLGFFFVFICHTFPYFLKLILSPILIPLFGAVPMDLIFFLTFSFSFLFIFFLFF